MRCSFESLKEIAIKYAAADFEKGDVCYFENATATRRKLLFQLNGMIFQLYWMRIKGAFVPVTDKDGALEKFVPFNY